MMMYSSRAMFRTDDDNDVARDLLSKSKYCTHFQQNEDLPLPEAQCHARVAKGWTNKEFNTYPLRRVRILTLVDRSQYQQ